jgi:hypothetical protein
LQKEETHLILPIGVHILFFIANDRSAIKTKTPTEVRMALQLGDVAPDFEADTTEGRIKFHDYIGNGWVVFFSHPKDFTPVCTTELGAMARMQHEFDSATPSSSVSRSIPSRTISAGRMTSRT